MKNGMTATQALKEIEAHDLKFVRFSFADQHGILRGKTLAAAEAKTAFERGVTVPSTLLLKDTSHKTVIPTFTRGGALGMRELQGAADVLMMPDASTFRILPWAADTGWFLCDLAFRDGRPVPMSTRAVLRSALEKLRKAGHELVCGLELEFHVFRIVDPSLRPSDAGQPGTPPEVELLNTGYQHLTEQRFDQFDPVAELLRKNLAALHLPLRSFEVEYGPSQFELTLGPQPALECADDVMLVRSAIKQVTRRNGYHASFMCRPKIPNVMSSGWHLHQSLRDPSSGKNVFVSDTDDLSETGRRYLAGVLAHARGASPFSTPTLNGYKRFRPYSLAPDRLVWGKDDRGALLRVIGAPGDPTTRIENRMGEPAANPYLYIASQVHSGLDGLARQLALPPSSDSPYETQAEALPHTLAEALGSLKADEALCAGFGRDFVDYFCRIKQAEIDRFNLEVSDWEHREYFDIF